LTRLADLAALTVIEPAGTGRSSIAYAAHIGPEFTIGPKVHGGSLQLVVAAAARRALHELADPDADPALIDGFTALAVTSDFLAAPDPAEVRVSVEIVKRGRTVALARVEVGQGGRLMVTSTVTLGRQDYGEPRHRAASSLDALPPQPGSAGMPLDGSGMAEIVHLGPAVDLVLDVDSFPALQGRTGEPEIRGWVRAKDADAQPAEMLLDLPVLVCDVSPPVVMNLGMFGWAPTVQLTTYLRRKPAPGWLRFAATSSEVGHGMFAEDHLVLDETGAVVAQSRQLALIPAR